MLQNNNSWWYCILSCVLIYLMHHESGRVPMSISRPVVLATESLEVDVNKMLNLFDCLGSCWKSSAEARVSTALPLAVLHLCQPWTDAKCSLWRCSHSQAWLKHSWKWREFLPWLLEEAVPQWNWWSLFPSMKIFAKANRGKTFKKWLKSLFDQWKRPNHDSCRAN